MMKLIDVLMKTLRREWRTMGRSSYGAVMFLMGIAYLLLSLQIIVQFLFSKISRFFNRYDDMRSIQSWDKPRNPPTVNITKAKKEPGPIRTRFLRMRNRANEIQEETEARVHRGITRLRVRANAGRQRVAAHLPRTA